MQSMMPWVAWPLLVGLTSCRTPAPIDFLPITGEYHRIDWALDPLGEADGELHYEVYVSTDQEHQVSVVVERDTVAAAVYRVFGKSERARECVRATEGGRRATILLVDSQGNLQVDGRLALPRRLQPNASWLVERVDECEFIGRVLELTPKRVVVERSMRCGADVTILYIEHWELSRGRTRIEDGDGVLRSQLSAVEARR